MEVLWWKSETDSYTMCFFLSLCWRSTEILLTLALTMDIENWSKRGALVSHSQKREPDSHWYSSFPASLCWFGCISMRKTAEHIRASQSLQISLKSKVQSKVQQSRFHCLVFVFVSQEWNFTRLTMQFKFNWVGIILRCKKRSNPFIVSSCETGTICDFFQSWKLKEVWNSLAYLAYLHQNVL